MNPSFQTEQLDNLMLIVEFVQVALIPRYAFFPSTAVSSFVPMAMASSVPPMEDMGCFKSEEAVDLVGYVG